MLASGERVDLTSSQVGTKLRADEILAQQAGSSRNQVQRFIRLTELIPELLDRVTFTSDTLRKYFPRSYTPARMQKTIIKLLEQWQRKRQRDQER